MSYQSYRDLEIYQLFHKLAVEAHNMIINKLPKFETHEEGSQIRRLSKPICSNIVERFVRRRCKNEFIRFLAYALVSCDEAREHLDSPWTGSLKDKETYKYLTQNYGEIR